MPEPGKNKACANNSERIDFKDSLEPTNNPNQIIGISHPANKRGDAPQGGSIDLMFNRLTSIRQNSNNTNQNTQFDIDDIDAFISYEGLDKLHEKHNVVFIKNVHYLHPPEAYEQFIGFMRPYLTKTYELGTTTVKQACSARIGDFTALKCPLNNHEVVVPSYAYVGDYNPIKGDNSVKASASRLVNKLIHLKDKDDNAKGGYLIRSELTFPEEVSVLLYDSKERDKVLHKAKLCIKEFIEYLRNKYCSDRDNEDIGLYYNLHLWKTENPLKPHLHFHLNWLNFISKKEIVNSVKPEEQYKAYTTRLQRKVVADPDDERFSREYRINEDGNREPVSTLNCLIRFNPRVNADDLKKEWTRIVNRRFKLKKEKIDAYFKYISLKNRSAVLHRIKYCSRKPLMDIFEYYTQHDFDPDEVNKDFVNYLMRYENRRTAIGFTKMLNRIVVADDIKRVCPICGNAARRTAHYSFADLNEMLQSGSYVFIQWNHQQKEYEIIRSKHKLKQIMNSLGGVG